LGFGYLSLAFREGAERRGKARGLGVVHRVYTTNLMLKKNSWVNTNVVPFFDFLFQEARTEASFEKFQQPGTLRL
jgi:hypothetical protein